jgi:hypothetical protein
MAKVKVKLKNRLNRSYPINLGRGRDPITVRPGGSFEVDLKDFEGSHIQGLLQKRFLREVRRRTIEDKPPAPQPAPYLSSSRKTSKKKKAKEETPPPSDTTTDDPVLPDAEKDGKKS